MKRGSFDVSFEHILRISGKDKSFIWPLFLIRAGHHLAGFLAMGAILDG